MPLQLSFDERADLLAVRLPVEGRLRKRREHFGERCGFVAQQVALAAPKRVSRLILVGSTTTPRTISGMSELDSIIRTLKDPVPTAFLREFQVSTVYDGVSSDFIDRAVEESTKLPAHAWRGLLDGLLAADPPTALGTSGIPTLVLWGEKDTYAVAAEQAALVALIRTATLKSYPKTGHAPHWEKPTVFARDVLAFIAKPVAN